MSKSKMLRGLATLVHKLFEQQESGVHQHRVVKMQGHVDGYMQALLDAGIASQQELLQMVSRQRARVRGPATRPLGEPAEAVA